MRVGIVGFSGSGRRSVFRLLSPSAETGPGRATRRGVLKVPDPRLDVLARIHHSRKTTPATIELVLIPGLEGTEAKDKLDLAALRNVDVLVHVVRAFEEPSVAHPEGSIDPRRDIELMELELTLADLAVVDKRLERLAGDAKKGKKPDPRELAALDRARAALAEETPLRAVLKHEDQQNLRGYALLTAKPCLLVVNVGEQQTTAQRPEPLGLESWQKAPGMAMCSVSARIEAEIAELSPEDARAFREDLGLAEGAAERIVRAAFELLDQITFYTADQKETRAWVVPRGTPAVRAAGAVHSDLERGFIRAEVVSYEVLVSEGSWSTCRDKGLVRLEGKDYPVAEGDVIYFRFHV